MKNRRPQSIDGFALRRRSNPRANPGRLGVDGLKVPDRFVSQPKHQSNSASEEAALPQPGMLSRSDLDASLQEIDAQPVPEHKAAKPRWRRLLKLPRLTKKRLIIGLVLLMVIFGAYFGIKAWIASGRIFGGNLFDLLGSGVRLKEDENGRSNILIFGTSEDDPGHDGADLTDSIMVLSISQDKKDAYMVSVPRDLWVEYGQGCMSGYEGKINVLYQCYSDEGKDEVAGAKALQDKVGDVLGLDVQYFTKANYTAVRDLVDAVGGVTVEIDSDDPRGVLDRNFDWKCNYNCYYVKWPNGPAKLNGEQALALARARNAAGGYGLSGGNFDREQYQQKILVALRDKADDAGTLANPVKVGAIIDAIGNNVRTSFSAGEVKTLINLAGEINAGSIKSINLIDERSPVLTTGSYGGQSIVQPIAGIYDFSDVHRYVNSKFNATGVTAEDASVEVLNGSDKGGVATTKADELEAAGLINVSAGDTATRAEYAAIQWYDLSGGKTATAAKLKEVLGQDAAGSTLPNGVRSSADFVIILGNGTN